MQITAYLRIIFFFCISISLSSCSQYLKSSVKSSASAKQRSEQSAKFHRVAKGETLYSIAWDYGYDYRQIALWNDIDFPYLIKPNQTIRLYPSLIRGASKNTEISHSKRANSSSKLSSAEPKRVIRRAKRSTRLKRAQSSKPKVEKPSGKAKYLSHPVKYPSRIKWLWPVRGKIVHHFNSKRGKKGIDIAGRSGQRIVAAAGGRVVYSGSGLRGYGKLIIIKHNDTYLSAYANNKKILVKEQQKVKSGQHIADMGSNGANITMLHFEIRKNGKPVNPVRYLPR